MSADLPQTSRVSRRLRWLLIGSLALNVLVLGSVAGMSLRHIGGPHPSPQAERSVGFGPWGSAFTREDHKQIRRLFEAKNYDFRADMRAEREDRAKLLAALRAEPFDGAALRDLIATSEARSRARMALGNEVVIDYVTGLSPEARKAAADRMEAADRARREARRERRTDRD